MQAPGNGRPVVLNVSGDAVVVVWALGCGDRPGERVELQDRPHRLVEELYKVTVVVLVSAAVDFHCVETPVDECLHVAPVALLRRVLLFVRAAARAEVPPHLRSLAPPVLIEWREPTGKLRIVDNWVSIRVVVALPSRAGIAFHPSVVQPDILEPEFKQTCWLAVHHPGLICYRIDLPLDYCGADIHAETVCVRRDPHERAMGEKQAARVIGIADGAGLGGSVCSGHCKRARRTPRAPAHLQNGRTLLQTHTARATGRQAAIGSH